MEAVKFLVEEIGLDELTVARIHLRSTASIAFVQLKEEGLALQTVEEHDGKHLYKCDGKEFAIPITMDDQSVIVKLHDLTAEVSDEDIKKLLLLPSLAMAVGTVDAKARSGKAKSGK
uniref:Uncharacterized protein n=1 Tax=Anopheles atroparvus TaxID=41427 RepID=A0A182J1R8_ANOAO